MPLQSLLDTDHRLLLARMRARGNPDRARIPVPAAKILPPAGLVTAQRLIEFQRPDDMGALRRRTELDEAVGIASALRGNDNETINEIIRESA